MCFEPPCHPPYAHRFRARHAIGFQITGFQTAGYRFARLHNTGFHNSVGNPEDTQSFMA